MTVSSRRGSILLYVISGIALAAAIGMGMFYMTSTSSMSRFGGNAMDRAHYLALAGKDYALANWETRSDWNNDEFTLSDTERFTISYADDTITSTGIVHKDAPLETRKEIKALKPSRFNPKKEWRDTFEDLTNWSTDTQVGGHAIATVSGDKALQVTGSADAFGSYGVWSFLQFNPSGAGVDLSTLWQNAGYCLSYDLQVKIANSQPYYVAGLIFKVAGTGDNREFYGVSYMRTKQKYVCYWYGCGWERDDNIPSEIKPNTNGSDGIFTEPLETFNSWGDWYRYSRPAIVLWKKQGSNLTWLAYKLLTNTDLVVDANNRLVDWSNIQVRLIEAYPLNFTNGGPTALLYGTKIEGATSRATAWISGTPIMTTTATWSSSTASGTLTLAKISGTFQSGENLLVDGEVRARASGTLGTTKRNYIRVYYGDVSSHGTPNDIPADNNRLGNPRMVTGSGNIIHWPADNVSEWKATNDYMTLVQWEAPNAGAIRLGASGTKEANAIIQDSSLLTPNIGTIDYSGIALHATGNTATSTYFDDFAIQY